MHIIHTRGKYLWLMTSHAQGVPRYRMRECSIRMYKKAWANQLQQSDATAEPFFSPWTHPLFSERTLKLCSTSIERIHAVQNFWDAIKLKLYKAAVLLRGISLPRRPEYLTAQRSESSISVIPFFIDFSDLLTKIFQCVGVLVNFFPIE